jgi:hypothetical protein
MITLEHPGSRDAIVESRMRDEHGSRTRAGVSPAWSVDHGMGAGFIVRELALPISKTSLPANWKT